VEEFRKVVREVFLKRLKQQKTQKKSQPKDILEVLVKSKEIRLEKED
jgi:hypothetical protein